MRARLQRTSRRETPDLDVTAFLSLMVILVPFLLITAVFSRMTILEIQSLPADDAESPAVDPLQLVVTVRDARIEVSGRGLERVQRIARTREGTALDTLATLVDGFKTRFPDSLEATILVEPQIPYDLVVKVLDVVRLRAGRAGDAVASADRFPLVTLGETAVRQSPPAAAK